MEFTLPPAPRGLCFDRNDFVKTNFSVDNFLAEHQNVASLESMRDDLGVYLKVLRLAMIELINKDYANFVNLCATLIGFDKTIEKIQVPLGQLNEEVLSVRQCLEDAMKEVAMWMSQRHTLQKKKQLLKYYSQTINGLKTLDNILNCIADKNKNERIALADRGAMQYNQLKFSIKKCESLIKVDQKKQFDEVGNKLIQTLNELLFQFWNDNDEDNLLKTLLTLATLDRVTEIEILIRKQAIAPLLQDIINEPSLQRSKEGLEGIYSKILALLNTKLKLLSEVTQHSKLTFLDKKYRFLVNCFWCEVESRLEVNLASIFAPGNPQIFYRRYTESMQFVKKLEEYCPDEETVKFLRETIEYRSFQKRWNLPVYFQIRFQEIAGGFESSLQKSPTVDPQNGFELAESRRCWRALQDAWSDGVFVEALGHKFWKLSLQVLARYAAWAAAFCTQRNSSKHESGNVNKPLIDDSISIYVDVRTLTARLPQFLLLAQSRMPAATGHLLQNSLRASEETLQSTKKKIQECIVSELFDKCNVQLKQVSDVPRLYRKTNRSVPSQPGAYLPAVGAALTAFRERAAQRLDAAFMADVLEALFNAMTVSYYKYVEDVLTSVYKTEESLRRLKQIREMSSQHNDSAGITDGDKIRLQLNVDVVHYGKMMEMLEIDVNNVQKYKEISCMVMDAIKNIDIK